MQGGDRRYSLVIDQAPSHGSKDAVAAYTAWGDSPNVVIQASRSPDPNALDFYLWSRLKAKLAEGPRATSVPELKLKIFEAFGVIAESEADAIKACGHSYRARLEACVAAGGVYVEAD